MKGILLRLQEQSYNSYVWRGPKNYNYIVYTGDLEKLDLSKPYPTSDITIVIGGVGLRGKIDLDDVGHSISIEYLGYKRGKQFKVVVNEQERPFYHASAKESIAKNMRALDLLKQLRYLSDGENETDATVHSLHQTLG